MMLCEHATEHHHVVLEQEPSDRSGQFRFHCTRCDGTDFILDHSDGTKDVVQAGDWIYLPAEEIPDWFTRKGFTVEIK